MNIRIIYNLFILVMISVLANAQELHTVSMVKNYNDWGWDCVYVAKNKYISVAVVPDAAGRILEYNLGNVPSLWLKPDMFGKSFEPTDEVKGSDWRNFGGYRLVPIPVDNCAIGADGIKTKRWPPPAIIGDSPYQAFIEENSGGVKSIVTTSGIQNLPVPTYNGKTKSFNYPSSIDEQLQYQRSLHIEDASSFVYIKHTLHNVGEKEVTRGIMTTSQHVSQSQEGLNDGENYVAYIPFSKEYLLPNGHQYEITATPESRWRFVNRNRMPLDNKNPEHLARYYNHGTNWTGEVAPGIFELHFDYDLMSGFHIISSKSWICYVNKNNKTAFAKIFEPYNKELNYDHGVNMSIYNSGLETGYLETEVKTPIHKLKSGESFDYHEKHASAKLASLPVLDVNDAGIITQKLSFNISDNRLSGKFGVFREGKAVVRVIDVDGNVVQEFEEGLVNPFAPLELSETVSNTPCEGEIQLLIMDKDKKVFVLDSYELGK